MLLDDIFEHDLGKVAKHLGITPATLKRWQRQDDAPRAALLALFYESRWGYSLLYTTAFNAETYARQECDSLKRTNAALRLRIARLEAIGDFGAANAPALNAGYLATAPLSTVSDLGTGPRSARPAAPRQER